jgi:chromosome partitioning protein
MFADYIVMPVCGSIFDRESASDCLAELRKLPRIVTGKCELGVVGMRVEQRAGAASVVENWARTQQVPVVASLTESRPYVSCIEQGLTLFDLDPASVHDELEEWKPLLRCHD